VSRRRTVIPNHPGKEMPMGTLRAIIEQSGLMIEEFVNL